MANFIINNKCDVITGEKTTLEIITNYLRKSLNENEVISIYMIADFRFFDSFSLILPLLKELFDKELLKSFFVLITSRTAMNPKDFLFKFKTDSIIINEKNFYLINILNNAGVLRFRVNYKDNINTLMYSIHYKNKIKTYVGNASFSANNSPHRMIDFVAPTSNNSKMYFAFFKKLWNISEARINSVRIVTYLKRFSNAQAINLSPRNFIAVILKSISKDYLVKNISSDLSQVSEYKNMGYYSCIEKMQKYGSAIFANSIGLSEIYIASMIVKFYFEKNLRTLIICSFENEISWEHNFSRIGLKKSFAQFINRADLQKSEFISEQYTNIDLIIIDNAEYFSISKDKNNRRKNIDCIVKNNPDAHMLMVSKNILNDSLEDLITIYNIFARGKYGAILEKAGINIPITSLKQAIETQNVTNETIDSIKNILNTFMVKIEWTNLDFIVDPLQQDLNKPSITTVKYAYDHEISVKIYEKLINTIKEFRFEYCKLKFNGYYENSNLTNWYKWRLSRTIESSLISFIETLKKLALKTKATIDIISPNNENVTINKLFTEDQITNIKTSFKNLNDEVKGSVIENLNNDIAVINAFLTSSQAIRYLENRDEKVTSLLKILNTESKPTIIFSESDETIYYLRRRLLEYGNVKSAIITGETTDVEGDDVIDFKTIDVEDICTQFENGDYNILIANDCIAEEIKLPRTKVIINFDMPINPSSLSKRNRIASTQPTINKIKIYNFQSDRRIDKEILLFETLKTPLHELIAYYDIDFILWCFDERRITDIKSTSLTDFYLLTKEYKDFLAKKNTDEIKSKFTQALSAEDMALREFIKQLNISEETLKLAISEFKKPLFTSLYSETEGYYAIYQTANGIKTTRNLVFSNTRGYDIINSEMLKKIENDIHSKSEEKIDFIIGIIHYSPS